LDTCKTRPQLVNAADQRSEGLLRPPQGGRFSGKLDG